MRLSIGRHLGPWWLGASFRPTLRPRARYWTHPGCPIRHRRQDTAQACARRLQQHRP